MAREQAMFAVSHCRYGVVKLCWSKIKKIAGTGRFSAMRPAHLKRQQLFVSNDRRWCQSIRTVQGCFFIPNFQCPERTFWMPWATWNVEYFCFFVASFLWQEHQALSEKSESPMTTDDSIELTINPQQSIQPIGNNYIFAKKGNISCSGSVYSYIPALAFDSQQVRHITNILCPWLLPAGSSKSNRYSTAHTDFLHLITYHIKR